MNSLKYWLPAIVWMAVIFGFSSIPSREMPSFGLADFLVKKGGHALGYAMLALAYLRGLKSFKHKGHKEHEGKRTTRPGDFLVKHTSLLAWLMAVLFSATDEFHQAFVPGRHPSLTDVLVFDNLGALFGVAAFNWFTRWKQKGDAPAPPD